MQDFNEISAVISFTKEWKNIDMFIFPLQPGMGHVNTMLSQNHSSKEHSSDIKQLRRSRSTILGPKQGTFHKVCVLISLEVVFWHVVMTDEAIWSKM